MIGVMIQTAFLVIAILAVQKALGDKLHAYVRYGLWLLVAFRLMLPVNFIDSPFSMLRVTGVIRPSAVAEQSVDLQRADSEGLTDSLGNHNDKTAKTDLVQTENSVQGTEANSLSDDSVVQGTDTAYMEDAAQAGQDSATGNIGRMSGNLQTGDTQRNADTARIQNTLRAAFLSGKISTILYAIWLTGSLLVGGFLGFSHFRFRRRLYKSRQAYTKDLPDTIKETRVPIYRVKGLETPCLVGSIHPAIYIGTDIDTITDSFRYTITHEEVHYLHRDHIWAFVRAVLVTVYWFHPFVWIAAAYSIKDGEIACDYGTVQRLGKEEWLAYGEMLLNLSQIQKGKRVYSYGTMLRPSKSELKRRILRLTQTNGSRVWAGILAILLMVVAAGCAFTGASKIDGGQEILLVNEEGKDSVDEAADDGNKVVDSGDTRDENEGSNEKVNLPDNEDTYNMEPRQLEAKPAEISEDTPFGVDGPRLDYAGGMGTEKGSRIIFHDYFGLIVYDLSNREIVRSLDLASIGCDMTQGDDYCQVVVSADGETVWLHPISKRYMYRYEVEENLLYQEPLVKTLELDLEAEELFDRHLSLSMEPEYTDTSTWYSNYLYEQYKDEQGLHNAYIYMYVYLHDSDTDDIYDSRLMLRNLNLVWDDMVFILFEDSADIPEEIKHKRFQDDQTDGASETEDADAFPYNYHGNVVDVEIIYDKPCNYTRISDVFGGRTHPITGEVILHEGIDYVAAEGTDIWAAADGVVYETGYSAKYGNYVVLGHINGDMTYYCCCQEVTVKKDDQVKRGDKIATVGSSGQSTGPHLHFALSKSGWFVNPESYMEVVLNLD